MKASFKSKLAIWLKLKSQIQNRALYFKPTASIVKKLRHEMLIIFLAFYYININYKLIGDGICPNHLFLSKKSESKNYFNFLPRTPKKYKQNY